MAVVYRRQQEMVLVFYYQESLFDDGFVQDIQRVSVHEAPSANVRRVIPVVDK